MIKILVVCKANYCRSPVMEALLNHYTHKEISVASRGTMQFFKHGMDRRSLSYLKSLNIKPKKHYPTQLKPSDLDITNLIYAADNQIKKTIIEFYPVIKHKVFLYSDTDIEDPINLTDDLYLNLMKKIDEDSKKLSEKLKNIF